MSFGQRLQKLRITHHMNFEQLAKACDVDPILIEHIELNQNMPSILFVQKVARYFNVSTDYLLGMVDNKETIMSVVQSGKTVGDVVIQMLYEMGVLSKDKDGEYYLESTGIILTEKEQNIIDMVRRENYIRKLIEEAENLGQNIDDILALSPEKKDEIISHLQKRLSSKLREKTRKKPDEHNEKNINSDEKNK